MSIRIIKRILWSLYKEFDLHNSVLIERAARADNSDRLAFGPFKGFIYPKFDHKGELILASKYLGTFEKELFPFFEVIKTRTYSDVLNIGSADGYYSVGCALMFKTAKVHAWEMDPYHQGITTAVAQANNVADRVELRGFCTPEELRAVSSAGHSLIICDCEGGEDQLLVSQNLMGLKSYDILVECHDVFVPGITQRVKDRFSPTHDIQEAVTQLRSLSDINPELLKRLPRSQNEIVRSIEEPRLYEMSWLLISSRA